MHISHGCAWLHVLIDSQFKLSATGQTGKQQVMASVAGSLDTHTESLVPSCSLDPTLTVVGIWGVNVWLGDFSLSFFCFANKMKIDR